MESHDKHHVAGAMQHNKKFLIKLMASGVFSAFGLFELGLNIELAFVALIFVPATGLFFTYLKMEANSTAMRFAAIFVVAVIFGLLLKSFFLAIAFFLVLEGATHRESVIRYKDVKWLKGVQSLEKKTQLHKFLENHALFRTLPQDICEKMDDHCLIIEVEEGSALIKEGEFNHYLYLLAKGSVDVSKDELWLASLNAGDIFGEISALGLSLPVADVIATSDVLAFAFPIPVINETALECPKFEQMLHEIGMRSKEQ